jgi:hypothetical protein
MEPPGQAAGTGGVHRMAVDEATGFTFVGNVGPDANNDDPARGPRGYDEVETIPPGGGTNHGWPRCIGDNIPYVDWDYAAGAGRGLLSCEGMAPADIFYPYAESTRWPVLGNGSRTAIGGVVYRYQGEGPYRLPDTYQGKFLFMEWARDRIWSVPIVEDPESPNHGRMDTANMTQIASGLISPIDAAVGPDGAVYIAEYGLTFYLNPNSRISRIVPKQPAEAPPPGSPQRADGGFPPAVAALAGILSAGAAGARRRKWLPV